MKHSNTKRLSWMFGLMMILVLAAQPAKATPILTLEGTLSGTTSVTGILTLTLGSTDSVYSADFSLSYDPLLTLSSATDLFSDGDNFLIMNSTSNPLLFTLTPLLSLTEGVYQLASLTFTSSTPGAKQLSFGGTSGYPDGPVYADDSFDQYALDATNPTITLSGAAPVPEPATMLLLGSGLAGLGAMRSKRRQVATKKA